MITQVDLGFGHVGWITYVVRGGYVYSEGDLLGEVFQPSPLTKWSTHPCVICNFFRFFFFFGFLSVKILLFFNRSLSGVSIPFYVLSSFS